MVGGMEEVEPEPEGGNDREVGAALLPTAPTLRGEISCARETVAFAPDVVVRGMACGFVVRGGPF